MVKCWQDHPDPVLSDLARRFIGRDLLKKVNGIRRSHFKKIRGRVERAGYDPRYYFIVDNQKSTFYDYYRPGTGRDDSIYVLKDGKNVPFSTCSRIVRKLMGQRQETGCYLPADVRKDLLRRTAGTS